MHALDMRFRAGLMTLAALVILAPVSNGLAADSEIERTISIIELRHGPDASSLTVDYLKALRSAFQQENKGDYILVPVQTAAEKLGKKRAQVPGSLTAERRTSLSEAKKMGVQYLDKADAVNAIKALNAAKSKYRPALAAPGADAALRKEYLDVLAKLATAHVVAEQKDNAAEVFREVITTFGLKAPITDDFYRPDVVEIFNSVVKDVTALQKGSIDVSSTPLGAGIILNGADRGKTPSQVADLLPGDYSLRLQRGSDSSMLHTVRVDGGKVSKVNIDIPFESHLVLDENSVGLSYKDMDEATRRIPLDAMTLGRAVELNLVAVVGVIDDKLAIFLIDVGQSRVISSNNSISVPQVGLSKKAVQRALSTMIGSKKGVVAAQAGDWYTSVPGWAVSGVGAVSLIVGLIYSPYLASAEYYPCPNPEVKCVTEPNHPSYSLYLAEANDRASEHESGQVVSGVTLILGVAALGAGAYLFYRQAQGTPLVGLGLDPEQDSFRLPPAMFGSEPAFFPALR